jgi:hypothetical protein
MVFFVFSAGGGKPPRVSEALWWLGYLVDWIASL